MRRLLFLAGLFGLFSSVVNADEYATTDSGKRILIKDDGTWEYVKEEVTELKAGSSGFGIGGGGTADGFGGMDGAPQEEASGLGRGSSSQGSVKSGGSPTILGPLDKALIEKVVRRDLNQIKYCYTRELTKDPSLKGKVVVKFTIAKDGSVSKASIKSSTLGSRKVDECVTDRFRKLKFPAPNGGAIVIVSYPLIFH